MHALLRAFSLLVSLLLLLATTAALQPLPAVASSGCTSYSLTNGRIGFGGPNQSNTGTFNYANSVESNGILKQPFYKSGSTWYKLTYSSRSLEFAIGHGSSGAAWPTSNVTHITSAVVAPVIDATGFVSQGASGSVCFGYGVLKTTTVVGLASSKNVKVEQTFTLGQNDRFVEIRTKVINDQSAGNLSNVQIWVGTGDDYVGTNDGPTKKRGNLVDGAFQISPSASASSSALLIESGSEGVLFYSTTPNTSTSHKDCCDFVNAYGQNPATNAVTATGDGSYALFLPVGALADGASSEIVWYYAAGATADLAAVAQAVAAAAAPAVPTGVPNDQAVALSWEQPSSSDPIIGYRIRYTADNGATYSTFGSDFQGDSAPRTLSITGLTNGTEYKFQVMALTGSNTLTGGVYSSATTGLWSNSSAGIIAGAPSAPSISSITPGNQKLTVSFSAPASTGGFPVTDYEYSTDNGSTWSAGGSTVSPIVISGLTNGTTYQVKLRAKGSFSGVASTSSTGTPAATVAGAPTLSAAIVSSQLITVVFTGPVDNGGSVISNYKYSTDGVTYWALSPLQTTSPITIQYLSSDGTTPLTNGIAYSISLKAVNGTGDSPASNSLSATPALPSAPAATSVRPQTVIPLVPTAAPPRAFVVPPILSPVLQNNQLPAVPNRPTGLVNGVPTQVSTLVTDPNNLNIRTGVLNIGINVQQDQGLVRQGTNGETEVQVRKGGVTAFQGSGLAPRSFVQVFMPLQGTNAKELARIPVDERGAFNGEAMFQTGLQDAPLPIGRQVLQMVTVDEQGRQNVVEIAVNIVQPSPAPEINREKGETPALLPGQSLATNGGVPEVVDVTVIPDQKQTVIEGDGWTMAIAPQDDNSSVTEKEDGEVLLELVRDESASVSGSGFMPNTRADVWLFSTPTLLGTVDIDENGEFNGTVEIDGQVINVGEHTLQMQGVGKDGYVRAANLGVVVNDVEGASPTADTSTNLLFWTLIGLGLIAIALVVLLAASRARISARG